jgi:hypothetical protein
MKSAVRLLLAVTLLLCTRSIASAVTTAECQQDCTSLQWDARSSCYSGCQQSCRAYGGVWYNVYFPGGCYADPSQSYCVVDGECDCDCEYI